MEWLQMDPNTGKLRIFLGQLGKYKNFQKTTDQVLMDGGYKP